MSYLSTFERKEVKYLIPPEKYSQLSEIVSKKLFIDEYGKHTICNLYFDTDDYALIRASMEKPVYKEKLRLRGYIPYGDNGISPDQQVFLELKKKYKGIVYKRRASMTNSDAMDYFENRNHDHTIQILNEIDYFLDFYGSKPKVFIAYDRIAMTYPSDENFRVTFDSNIRSRTDRLDLTLGSDGDALLRNGYVLMEVKAHQAMPDWFSKALNALSIYPVSFSKYGNVYSTKLFPNMDIKYQNLRSEEKCSQAFSHQLQQALALAQ